MNLARFYPITDDTAFFECLLTNGARCVQLRVKDRSDDDLRRRVRQARAVCLQAGAQLIVNDHWQIAIEEDCDCVHLGQRDLDVADVGAIKRAGVRIGISTHSHDELERALTLAPDYIALGPIYPTTIKQMPWAPQGLERIAEWKRLIGAIPLVAIGGLTVERATRVLQAGADSAAVISDIRAHSDPPARIREWVAITSRT